jgi:hypothetical protein
VLVLNDLFSHAQARRSAGLAALFGALAALQRL